MYLENLVIKNFRSLEDIEVRFDQRVSVIVGPNAIGKTTLLEAVRLTKALLAPRTQNEASQVLFSLGAATPYKADTIIGASIAGDVSKPIVIRCDFRLSDAEVSLLEKVLPNIAANLMFEEMGRSFANATDRIAALSTPDGMNAISKAQARLEAALSEIKSGSRHCRLELTIDPTVGLSSSDLESAALVSFLDRNLPPERTIFSYFPADRAIPAQEQPIQIGIADANAQLESHNSQPQSKYQRLKNTIFNTVISSPEGRQELDGDFKKIFERILKGRRLVGIGVNEHGLLNISIQDMENQKVFGIDAMSSGEKGLILTFLLIARSVAKGGVVILDEPELHLNPAVCRDLLAFLVEEYAITRDLQIIVCSHSPEILGGAFERDDCALYHLRSSTLLTLVRSQDEVEVSEALRRLGTSQIESLLYRATVFVEGEYDSEVLEAGFDKLFRRYKLKDLGGRREVEKAINSLQDAEKRGISVPAQFFIFDRDEAPTGLSSSTSVRILQWKKRCLENYLLDLDILTDLLKDPNLASRPVSSIGELKGILKGLALDQINDLVVREVYAGYSFESPGLRASEVHAKNFNDTSALLFTRLQRLEQQLCSLDETSWKDVFVKKCNERAEELRKIWDSTWLDDCDGKRLFADLQKKLEINLRLPLFKKMIIIEMRNSRTTGWQGAEVMLSNLLTAP